MPKTSVIVPNYNHARFLRRRIDTILAQTFQDFELILLDDCSTDESRSILREYASDPRVRMEFSDVNSGNPFKQWNKGVRLAQGKYVWIAESDDYADERFLERLVPLFESNPKMQFAYCRSWCVTEGNRLDGSAETHSAGLDHISWTADYCEDGREVCRKYIVRANIVHNASAVLFRKAVYEQVGGADETLRLCGDWKLWAAMSLTGKVAYLSEPLNYFRFHGASVRNKSVQGALNVTETLQVVRWILDRVTPPDAVLRKTYKTCADLWVPALMSLRVSFSLKRTILRKVRAVDPHPILRSLRAAPAAAWGLVRNSVWHPILNWTRPIRHSIGLNQANISDALKRNRREP
jgi:glycosyltransferase involved in cell wall biosynthesis